MKENGSELTVYPNPAKETVNLEYVNSDQQDYVKIFISDVTGKVVSITDWKLADGVNSNSVSLKKLADGVYFVTLKNNINGATMLQRKIIKN
ncbi:MAG: T9SS type A sorting domain-containing protein [Chitinophagaceae bacterium]|nr:MAG: T9SS type A sorting domain-containing protein [Chitinophagaceae bacterium]